MTRNFLFLLALFPSPSYAEEPPEAAAFKVSSSTSAGQGNFSEGITLSGDHPANETGSVEWSAGYSYGKTPVGGDSNKTNSVDLNVGYKSKWDFGAGFDLSSTPAENLTSAGPKAWLGYAFELGTANENGFQPKIAPKFTYKGETYKETFSGTVTSRKGSLRTVARPSTGNETIRQNEFTLEVELSPIELLSVRLSESSYKYNKDVAKFMGLLDSPKAVQTGAASFSSTLGGLPKDSSEFGVSLFPWESWTFNFDLSRTKVQFDSTTTKGAKFQVEKDLSKSWQIGLGFDREKSETQGEENLTLVDISFSF